MIIDSNPGRQHHVLAEASPAQTCKVCGRRFKSAAEGVWDGRRTWLCEQCYTELAFPDIGNRHNP